jgi:cytochrome c2
VLQGPNLGGLFGRTSGTTAGFSYSAANKDAAITWGEEQLYDYLLNPKKYIPGAQDSLSHVAPSSCGGKYTLDGSEHERTPLSVTS